MQLQATAKFISATVLSSAIAAALGVGPLYAAQDANEVAIVENVGGRVVAFVAGKPALLEALDVVSDGTRLDLQANSELPLSAAWGTCIAASGLHSVMAQEAAEVRMLPDG